jgi:adenosylcobyric acid synthase
MKNKLKPIMFVGTGSDVGKSIINAAYCRILKQDGYNPAPYKAQNMSLNSYATPDGLEIGRAQAVQADACGIPCSVEMNPVLLKPTTHQTAQVVLNGKPIGNQSAKEYFLGTNRSFLFEEVLKSYHKLAEKFNPVVMEGAGSISELNLKDKDITNMRVAMATEASTFLIADIDRGGVFGSVYGTIELLDPEERARIKGIVINKFRGDIDLFTDGRKMLEELTGVPVIAVIPYFQDIKIEQEDSVVVDNYMGKAVSDKLNIAVVLLKRMSNFTDFNALEHIPEVNLYYTHEAAEIEKADIVILPGSKNTISDLECLKTTGLTDAILKAHKKGAAVYGICGGYQMMGEEINDPDGVEGDIKTISGLGLLPVITTIGNEKVTEQCTFTFRNGSEDCQGYEIHMGETVRNGGENLCEIDGKPTDGCFVNDKVWGSYIHGIFDNQSVVEAILQANGLKSGTTFNYKTFKEEQFDKLAAHVREVTNMDLFYDLVKM